MKNILVTAALPYINNVPHLGHFAGSHLPADIFARYCRAKGYNVTFVGGSDEHGTPSVLAAKKKGIAVQDFVDELHIKHKEIYEHFNISYDIYSRTSSSQHREVVQEFFKNIDTKFLLEMEEEFFYSEVDKIFLPDRFVKGECPSCGAESNSDQCESCGKIMSVKELLNPKSVISGDRPILKKSKHVYLDLSKLSDRLDEWLESNRDRFKKLVYSEAKRWIREGLKARSITRDMDWGVPIPGYENKVFYVWFDAPIGYITFAKVLDTDWENVDSYHFLGKDNIPFHTIFWPGMLLSASKKLPKNVVGYNYLTYEGDKFSKSRGVGIFCTDVMDREDIDICALRFYLLSILPENKDSDFNWNNYKESVNSQLIGNISNFFNRTVSMVNRYFDGNLEIEDYPNNELTNSKMKYSEEIENLFESCSLRDALKKILEFSSLGNKYIDRTKPWILAKENRDELKEVLYSCLEHARTICIFLYPVTPKKIESFWNDQLNLDDKPSYTVLNKREMKYSLGESKPLYVRI